MHTDRRDRCDPGHRPKLMGRFSFGHAREMVPHVHATRLHMQQNREEIPRNVLPEEIGVTAGPADRRAGVGTWSRSIYR
jgi:hypothetical protein